MLLFVFGESKEITIVWEIDVLVDRFFAALPQSVGVSCFAQNDSKLCFLGGRG